MAGLDVLEFRQQGQRPCQVVTILPQRRDRLPLPYQVARAGYDVLLDFSFPPQFRDTARKILKEIPLEYILIRPSFAVCAARAAERAEGAIADYAMYRDFYALFEEEEATPYTLCDDEADAPALARRIYEDLEAGIFHVA